MDNSNYFKNLFESISDYRKIVLLKFLSQNDKNLFKEIGCSKNDINLLNLEFKNILIEGYEEYLEFVQNIKESAKEKLLKK